MARQLDLIDNFVANGQNEFTFEEARELLGGSRGATSNALRRLTKNGLLDRVIDFPQFGRVQRTGGACGHQRRPEAGSSPTRRHRPTRSGHRGRPS